MTAESYLPEPLERLTEALKRLPGVGRRSAARMALSMLEWDPELLTEVGTRIARLKEDVTDCPICGNLAAGGLCRVCADSRRETSVICIVETALQIPPIESSGSFRGVYHVLGGRIQPLEGKGPDDIRLKELRTRVEAGGVEELILATSSDVEGEATASFLGHEFSGYNDLKISRIASGVPVGADLSFADSASIAMAINSRRPAE